MFQPRDLGVESEPGLVLLLSNFELALLVITNILDFDLAAEGRENLVVGFENDGLEF